MTSKKIALIVGATGLVGKQVLNELLDNTYYEEIILLVRRSSQIKDSRIKEVIIDFDELESHAAEISANDYYCCIGTTMKAAKSKEAFYKIDHEYPMTLGKIALSDPNFEQYLLVSSLGANADSAIFYNRVKGELEDALKALGLKRLHIFQPSLLIGKRSDFRFFEELAKFCSSILSFFVIGSSKRLWAIEGHEVSKSMFLIAKENKDENLILRTAEMQKICRQH